MKAKIHQLYEDHLLIQAGLKNETIGEQLSKDKRPNQQRQSLTDISALLIGSAALSAPFVTENPVAYQIAFMGAVTISAAIVSRFDPAIKKIADYVKDMQSEVLSILNKHETASHMINPFSYRNAESLSNMLNSFIPSKSSEFLVSATEFAPITIKKSPLTIENKNRLADLAIANLTDALSKDAELIDIDALTKAWRDMPMTNQERSFFCSASASICRYFVDYVEYGDTDELKEALSLSNSGDIVLNGDGIIELRGGEPFLLVASAPDDELAPMM